MSANVRGRNARRGRNVFLVVDTDFGRSLLWFADATAARRELLATCRRMRCFVQGSGLGGELVSVRGGVVRARYVIGVEVPVVSP